MNIFGDVAPVGVGDQMYQNPAEWTLPPAAPIPIGVGCPSVPIDRNPPLDPGEPAEPITEDNRV